MMGLSLNIYISTDTLTCGISFQTKFDEESFSNSKPKITSLQVSLKVLQSYQSLHSFKILGLRGARREALHALKSPLRICDSYQRIQ